MSKLSKTIHYHWHFLVVVTILIVVMTWPTILYVFNTDVFWLPIDSGDIWIEFWNAWYGKLLLSGNASPLHTDLSFFPEGVSLGYHYFNFAHMIIFGFLQFVMPASNAFNLTYLLIIFSATFSAYIFLLYLFEDKRIALFGSVVFGFSGYIVGRPMHPGVALLATVPLALHLVSRAVLERRRSLALIAGVLIGVTAFIGLYVFVCLVLTVGACFLYFALQNWREKSFWAVVTVIIVVVVVFGSVRIYPMLTHELPLDSILDKNRGQEFENDLLQFFINYKNPLFNGLITNRVTSAIVKLQPPGRWNTSYLGYIPLILIGIGIINAAIRKCMVPWLILFLGFSFLRLGSVLTINGTEIAGFLLPKHFLDQLVPVVFEAFYSTDHFQVGALFPLAVLSCYGLVALFSQVSTNWRYPLVLVLIALLSIEYYRRPEEARIVPEEEVAFLDWLATEGEQELRLINLPMNRFNSKVYLFYQTLSGYPQVEGLATRTPDQAYDYIRSNVLLEAWRNKESIVCEGANRGEYLAALDQLESDGFSHIILHVQRPNAENIAASFANREQVYQDGFVKIFRLENLGESCP